ncbi:vanadium-dependent haloperoxidase [Ornithinimicrobium cerasi]|uniref:PAP2 superfamily protein n=1 Tax=Ornithinimicrobium cerasi TaxID=2248773 RepID=A0A285VW73_9MICO|nr:vanadium-dependent haloperoxidase [Ornithinimicrobium cerasi]SOC58299.1 hypothetical protein SAMN05421879_1289 [Ornithinimicrobium cerasi]
MTTTQKRLPGRRAAVATLAMLAVATLGSAPPFAAADSPDTVALDWHEHAVAAFANAQAAPVAGAQMAPYVQGVHLAMVQGAVYDAVNSIVGGYQPYLQGLPPAPAGASESAAVATAARDTMRGILDQAVASGALAATVRDAIVQRLQTLHDATLASADDGDVSQGVAVGQAAAAAMLAERAGDGRYGAFRFTCGDDPGQWRPVGQTVCTTPPTGPIDGSAWVAKVTPFVVDSNDQFLSKAPPALNTGRYAKEYDEVRTLGALGSVLTTEQAALASFYVANPVDMMGRSLRAHATEEGLDVAEQARFLAKVALTNGDTFITCWESKAEWSNWRPQTAIRLGDEDGNPRTVGDPGWTSRVPTPPYPEVASGYNCAVSSQMNAAELYFGSDRTDFTVMHPDGRTRDYDHFRDVVKDTVDARIYQGLHFRSADVDGATIGRDVARWVHEHALQPVG